MLRVIAGQYKNQTLRTPKSGATRPTAGSLRERVFNICQNRIEEASFLDIFAGSGAMGIEAMSRGAGSATFIDSSREACKCIQANLSKLQLTSTVQLLSGDALLMLKKLSMEKRRFDIIYVDPPYGVTLSIKDKTPLWLAVLQAIDEGSLLKNDGTLFLEEADDLPEAFSFKNIQLKSQRKSGNTILLQFEQSNSGEVV